MLINCFCTAVKKLNLLQYFICIGFIELSQAKCSKSLLLPLKGTDLLLNTLIWQIWWVSRSHFWIVTLQNRAVLQSMLCCTRPHSTKGEDGATITEEKEWGGPASFTEMMAFESVKPFTSTAFFCPFYFVLTEEQTKPETWTRWDSVQSSVEHVRLGHPSLC